MGREEQVNYEQLAMFMPARELRTDENISSTELLWVDKHADEHANALEAFVDADFDRQEEPDELWERKVDESWGTDSGAYEGSRHHSISEEGVKRPVTLRHGTGIHHANTKIMDGYHRIASAYDINPAMEVPVEHKAPGEPHSFDVGHK